MARSPKITDPAGPSRRRISFGGGSLALASVGFFLFLYTGSAAFLVALLPLMLFAAVVIATGALMLLETAVKAVKSGVASTQVKTDCAPPRPARREIFQRQTAP